MKDGNRIAVTIALCLLVLGLIAVLYTFVQHRYEATIVSVDKITTVESSGGKHGRRSHKVAYLTAAYTDQSGIEQTAKVKYSRPPTTLSAGQELAIVQSFDGFIAYPWSGLRMFGGMIAFGAGLFLFFMWLDRKPKA